MQFKSPLIRSKLVRRYKRFLSDHELENGETITAHVANPGSMLGLDKPGSETWLSVSDNPKRKLKYSWELVRISTGKSGLVGVNTHSPNYLAFEALTNGNVHQLKGYTEIRREVKYGTRNSRIDFLLKSENLKPAYVEVKNVTLRRESFAEFPDSRTARGTKHLNELEDIVRNGSKAYMLYLVQRNDCCKFRIAKDIDPMYYKSFLSAIKAGVNTLCYTCDVNTLGLKFNRQIPIIESY